MKNNHELETTLLQVMETYRYRGCIVTKIDNGWEVFGQKVSKVEEVDEVIDNATSILAESIWKGETVTVDAGSGSNSALNSI